MLRRIFILFLGLFLLSSCGEQTDSDSPASKQIEEYSQKLEDCKDGSAGKSKEAKAEIVPKKHVRGYDIEPDDMFFGNKDAKIVLVEYFSPTCPHCVTYHKRIFPKIKEKYIDTGKIAYVMREFIGNKQDLDATILARCSGEFDRYLKFTNVILNQQDSWAFNKNYREILTNIGTLGGISAETYSACLNDQEKIGILMANTKLVTREPNFIGTPSFFINGKQFLDRYTEEDLSKAIESAIAKVQKENNGS